MGSLIGIVVSQRFESFICRAALLNVSQAFGEGSLSDGIDEALGSGAGKTRLIAANIATIPNTKIAKANTAMTNTRRLLLLCLFRIC